MGKTVGDIMLVGGMMGLILCVFGKTTEHFIKRLVLSWRVSITGLVCVVSLGFRRNLSNNWLWDACHRRRNFLYSIVQVRWDSC